MIADLPKDFPERFAQTMFRMVGLNGHIPMHWPIKAKQALLSLFFGGAKSTRFDRNGRHQHTDQRGIFITKIELDGEQPYWRYEAKGSIGDFSGALTSIVQVYDEESSATVRRKFSVDEVKELAKFAAAFEGLIPFRSSLDAFTPKFAPTCPETALPWPAACFANPKIAPQTPRGRGQPNAAAGSV